MELFPLVLFVLCSVTWIVLPIAVHEMDNKRLLQEDAKERRYLEAVAMLTAEEKLEIGIE